VSSHRVDVAVVALAFAVFGLVALALVWSSDRAYAALANATGHTMAAVLLPQIDGTRKETTIDLPILLDWHRDWARYVVGISPTPPVFFGTGPVFTSDEYAHMADVRNVFRGAETVAVLGLGVMAFRVIRARGRGTSLRLARDGALAAAGVVAVVGIAAAVAFDPLFLLFHEVFFPQGNFLFDPATSNLLRLYPEWYWQGITAGVGVSFIALASASAGVAHLALRRAST
jgi:integral membrane protein (TIGR01906 family)